MIDEEFFSAVNSHERGIVANNIKLDFTFSKLNPGEKLSISKFIYEGEKVWEKF